MKKFNFRLQSVLDLKKQEEEAIQKELARLIQEYRKIEKKIDNLKAEKKNIQQKLEKEEGIKINPSQAVRTRNYIKFLRDEIEELTLKLNYWEDEIKKCRQNLISKTKEKKSLVKLRDRKYDEHWQEMLSEEQKLNDELAINKFNYKGNRSQGL
ncbi:flagellar export protein FliJ [Orenia marismortui]|uniref:Flagellar FliJ protein n=1 Tax=Orenia marismortui TaxID=46469 RepID=A0A4R8GZ58_9FIRM|nr:flagellar export protein FliJ [Orenia marismortui]TDX51931.1 flagellar FliJ protein [Orenia marismortui]